MRGLVERTRAKAYRSAFGTGAAARAAVVCVSIEQLLVADAGASLMASARATGAQLREISRLLGTPLPVYVIVTKLDRVAHFEEYVRNLSNVEVRQMLGSPLPKSEAIGRRLCRSGCPHTGGQCSMGSHTSLASFA